MSKIQFYELTPKGWEILEQSGLKDIIDDVWGNRSEIEFLDVKNVWMRYPIGVEDVIDGIQHDLRGDDRRLKKLRDISAEALIGDFDEDEIIIRSGIVSKLVLDNDPDPSEFGLKSLDELDDIIGYYSFIKKRDHNRGSSFHNMKCRTTIDSAIKSTL